MNSPVYKWALLLVLGLTACKEAELVPDPDPGPDPPDGTRAELTLDSLFLYAKEAYLWYDALPSYEAFDPRQYDQSSNKLNNFNRALFEITRYGTNSETGQPYEFWEDYPEEAKYSYIDEAESTESVASSRLSAISLDGTGNDLGFTLTAVDYNDIRVRYVTPGSPADGDGIRRGYRLVSLNGRDNLDASNDADVDFIVDALGSSSITASFETPGGETLDAELEKTRYDYNPVYKRTVFNSGGEKIGYLAYAIFSRSEHSRPKLNEAFNNFDKEGVTDLIIDLRYNGGGYVSTAEYLINLIAPSTANDKVMVVEHFNKLLQDGDADILAEQIDYDENGDPVPYGNRYRTYADLDYTTEGNTHRFKKAGPLDQVDKVVFLVTGSTASASELVINSLKPYMDVKVVGEKTFGKPVGFFPIRIDKYEVYYSMFQTKNVDGEGDYFDGMDPDATAADDVTRDFGDPDEVSTASAIAYITEGTFPDATAARRTVPRAIQIGEDQQFIGMIEDRLKPKAQD